MERILKFRFWTPDKRMLNDHKGWVADIGINEALLCSKDYGYIAMQFTGLLDRNNKEIYEGDIVKQEKWVSIGKYVNSIGVVKYKGINFTSECIGDWSGSNAELNGNAKVIGNIYENPELINS